VTPSPLRIVRRLPAPPEDVFDAWIDPESLRIWMCPRETRVAAVDARVGGRFRIVMRGAQGDVAGRESLVTIELRADGTGTELTLTHAELPDEEARRRHETGWTSIVEKLAAHFTPK